MKEASERNERIYVRYGKDSTRLRKAILTRVAVHAVHELRVEGQLSTATPPAFWVGDNLRLSLWADADAVPALRLKEGDGWVASTVQCASHGETTHCFAPSAFAVSSKSQLAVRVEASEYRRLGLEAPLSHLASAARAGDRLLRVDLRSPSFHQPKRGHARIQRALDTLVTPKAAFAAPSEEAAAKSVVGLAQLLPRFAESVQTRDCAVSAAQSFQAPVLTGGAPSSTDDPEFVAALGAEYAEWVGQRLWHSHSRGGRPMPALAEMSSIPPERREHRDGVVQVRSIRGFLHPRWVFSNLVAPALPQGASTDAEDHLVVAFLLIGVSDSPLVTDSIEHGFGHGGESDLLVLLFSSGSYLLVDMTSSDHLAM